MRIRQKIASIGLCLLLIGCSSPRQTRDGGQSDSLFSATIRSQISLNENWELSYQGKTQQVQIPHNLDDYYGYRQLLHGNLHGTAVYKKFFDTPEYTDDQRLFLRFEGIGTYATLYVNGQELGRHPVGRLTLTLDISDFVRPSQSNELIVEVEHPEMITDMPWVCGGCSSEWGFSEGSQPFGIFRPVSLEITDKVRIEPFGVHVWHNQAMDSVWIETEIHNYGQETEQIELFNQLYDAAGKRILVLKQQVAVQAGETRIVRQSSKVRKPKPWSLDDPYLYRFSSQIRQQKTVNDELITPFGFRTISWPVKRNDGDGRFYLNGKPVFLNGVCEYEHQFGQSHAFSDAQILSRVNQIQSLGFNAFREAHQPHNLLYQKLLDERGILMWSQFSAHIWYDTPAFRQNFKSLLRQWVKEHRNSPSLIMWGLQNESTLPESFARECTDIIREMDPTSKDMRVIVTCNGGTGTDWNVVQNWSGTYGGDLFRYADELKHPDQLLNGEYGAWRTFGFHQEPMPFDLNGDWTEGRAVQVLEQKIKLAESVRGSVCGQFQWIYSSHDNPGRRQPDEAYRLIDKVGPFNYKGLMTPWEEPTDAWYMYKANYVSPAENPIVYLVSHSWPGRFEKRKNATIEVFSNCDSVLLFNDAVNYPACISQEMDAAMIKTETFLGTEIQQGIGTHFHWENRDIRFNVLHAVGYYGGKPVAEDVLILHPLDEADGFDRLYRHPSSVLKGDAGKSYLYRINCGGDDYTDVFNQRWKQDNNHYSHSWAERFPELNPYLASQRVSYGPVSGVKDWDLLNSYRFGRHELNYQFQLPEGMYVVELYFIEPWYGIGSSQQSDYTGWRIFDVAVNDSVVIDDLDIWAESGYAQVLKKEVLVPVRDGRLIISFPEVKAGQALISAIAIATMNSEGLQVPIKLTEKATNKSEWSWRKANQQVSAKTSPEQLPVGEPTRQSVRYEAETAQIQGAVEKISFKNRQGIRWKDFSEGSVRWGFSTGLAQEYALRFHYMNTSGKPIEMKWQLRAANGNIIANNTLSFPPAEKWKILSTTTGSFINAGDYHLLLSARDLQGLILDCLEVQ